MTNWADVKRVNRERNITKNKSENVSYLWDPERDCEMMLSLRSSSLLPTLSLLTHPSTWCSLIQWMFYGDVSKLFNVELCLEIMKKWANWVICKGLCKEKISNFIQYRVFIKCNIACLKSTEICNFKVVFCHKYNCHWNK